MGESVEIEEAKVKEGDTVHIGHGTKGGTGVIGKVIRIKGNDVHIMNDRGDTFKGPMNRVTVRGKTNESFDKLTPAQQRDAERRLKPTRATVAKTRLPATDSEMGRNVEKWRAEMRGTTTQRRLRDARLRADQKAKVGESVELDEVLDTPERAHRYMALSGMRQRERERKHFKLSAAARKGEASKEDAIQSQKEMIRKNNNAIRGRQRAYRKTYPKGSIYNPKKSNESVEHLDELKTSTIRSYVNKAQDNNQKRAMRIVDRDRPDEVHDEEMRKLRKRGRYVAGAKAELDLRKIMKRESVEHLDEVSPPGFEGTVKAMKKRHSDKIDNPWALAWWMKNKGYKSHKKADGTNKEEK